jgi:hypothetical protein
MHLLQRPALPSERGNSRGHRLERGGIGSTKAQTDADKPEQNPESYTGSVEHSLPLLPLPEGSFSPISLGGFVRPSLHHGSTHDLPSPLMGAGLGWG